MSDKINELKDKYNEGYRCIYKDTSDGCTLHLKNFANEKSYVITSKNDMEIGEIGDFLDQIDSLKKKYGSECICSGGDE